MKDLVALTGTLVGLIAACGPAADPAAEVAAILAINERVRQAHWDADATAFLAAHPAEWLTISHGSLETSTRDETLPRLQQYLDDMTFSELSFQSDPMVHVSGDGRTAWLIGSVRVRGLRRHGEGRPEPVAFTSAWVDLYRKENDRWLLVARASTDAPLEAAR